MKVSVVGTGYVGLVSGVCLAELGHTVTCVDLDRAKVDRINQGVPPIYEADLEDMLRRNIGKSLSATTDLRTAVLESELSLIAVGTPFDGDTIDLSYIRQVSEDIGAVLRDKDSYHVVVVKSTVVPGTTDEVVLPILEQSSGKKAGVDFGVGMNPEFLKEGEAIADFMNPDRIVLGGIDERTRDVLANLYEVFHGVEKLRTDTRTAEMIKYAANALLATLISYANEIGNLSAAVGVDGVDVMKGVHLDKRFSPILASGERVQPGLLSYLAAGCGFGGSCFPKDVNALIAYGRHVGMPMRVLKAVIDVNADQPEKMMEMLYRRFPDLAGVKVAVLGMAFKPGTDDIRESPALPVTRALLDAGAVVSAYDPVAAHEAKKIFGTSVQFHDALRDAIAGAAAILIMTRWNQFQELPALVAQAEDSPLIIDGRRMLDKTSVPDYAGIGLPATLEPVSSAAS